MTSGRVYQPAVSKDAALAELQRCAGSHFDPACVKAFATVLGRLRDLPLEEPAGHGGLARHHSLAA
jgi:response regulator RpfG family c-di-GMP phosphodiesterase